MQNRRQVRKVRILQPSALSDREAYLDQSAGLVYYGPSGGHGAIPTEGPLDPRMFEGALPALSLEIVADDQPAEKVREIGTIEQPEPKVREIGFGADYPEVDPRLLNFKDWRDSDLLFASQQVNEVTPFIQALRAEIAARGLAEASA